MINNIHKAVLSENIFWRKHVLQRMIERNISRKDVIETILKGEKIQEYFDDRPFPSVLFLNFINNRPLHVVVALDEKEGFAYIITAYEPNLTIFENDYKTKKK
jgi:hypothetical protein